MALIKCPECGKEVSDKAESCPNCGFGVADYVKENKKEVDCKRNPLVLKWRDILRTMCEDGSISDVKYYVKSLYALRVALLGGADVLSKEEFNKINKIRQDGYKGAVKINEIIISHILGVFTPEKMKGPNTKFLFYPNEKGWPVPDLQYSDLVENREFFCEVVSCTCYGKMDNYIYCEELYEFSGVYKLDRAKYDTLHGKDKDIVNNDAVSQVNGPWGIETSPAFLIIHDNIDIVYK